LKPHRFLGAKGDGTGFFSIEKEQSTILGYHSTPSLEETPLELIGHTFAEAKRLHDRPLTAKMALRMNEPK